MKKNLYGFANKSVNAYSFLVFRIIDTLIHISVTIIKFVEIKNALNWAFLNKF